MTNTETQRRVADDPTFVSIKRFDFDIEKLLARYPEGVPDRIIGQALGISEAEVKTQYASIIQKLRGAMGVEV